MRRQQIKKQAGFTLIELLIALVVLTIAIIALTPMLLGALNGITGAGKKSISMYDAQIDMERAINIGTTDSETLHITFPDSSSIQVQGKTVDITKDNVTITTFIPRQ